MARTDENAGRGDVDLSMNDIREAYEISSGQNTGEKKFIDSPLFEGVSTRTKRDFEDVMRAERRTIQKDEVMTRHSVEIPKPGSTVPPSSLNPLWVRDRELIEAGLYDLPDKPDGKSKKQLGNPAKYEVLGLRAWFAGAVETPIAIVPGLQVRATTKQTVTRIPSLAKMEVPDADLARLMNNTAGVFSGLLATDNSAEIVKESGYTPHQVPNMATAEASAFSGIAGSREARLVVRQGFTPPKSLVGPHAIVLSGGGVFISKFDADLHRGRNLNAILEAGVVPLAQLGNSEDDSAENEALAFQWVGLNTARNEASAVFFPTREGSRARYVPLNDLTLRLLTLNSMAETAASMHRHIGTLQANESIINKIGKRWAGLRGLFGV
ncbi:MAG: hypothetical protein AAB383_02535 [Patescibacteria group bacterium]